MPASAESSRAPRRRRASGVDRRREIAEAALRLVAARGLRGFTTAALAAEIGVTDGALFRHFATKDDIVLAAIARMEELLFDGAPPALHDPLDRLGAFFRHRVEVVRGRPELSRVLFSEELALAAPPEGAARLAGFRLRSVAFVRGCLEEAARAGLLAPALDVEDAAVLVLGAILALAHAPAGERPRARPAGVWATLESFLRGRRPRPRSEPTKTPRRTPRR